MLLVGWVGGQGARRGRVGERVVLGAVALGPRAYVDVLLYRHARRYTLNAVGDLYELNVLFPPPNATAVAGAASAVGAEQQQQQQQEEEAPERHYTPGHGEVGEYGYGELLDCSAIIKVADVDPESDLALDSGTESADGPTALGARLLGRRGGAASARRRGLLGVEEEVIDMEEKGEGVRRRHGRDFWAAHNTWRSYYDMVRWVAVCSRMLEPGRGLSLLARCVLRTRVLLARCVLRTTGTRHAACSPTAPHCGAGIRGLHALPTACPPPRLT